MRENTLWLALMEIILLAKFGYLAIYLKILVKIVLKIALCKALLLIKLLICRYDGDDKIDITMI